MRPEDQWALRSPLLRRAIAEGIAVGDHRVGFSVLVDASNTVADVCAIPPSSACDYRDRLSVRVGASLLLLDRHAGQWSGEPGAARPGPIDDMLIDFLVPGWVVPLLVHARRAYHKADERGNRWTGTDQDLPWVMRAAGVSQ